MPLHSVHRYFLYGISGHIRSYLYISLAITGCTSASKFYTALCNTRKQNTTKNCTFALYNELQLKSKN